MIKEIIKKTFKPGTYEIKHSGKYTFIQYYPIEGSTMVSSYMIPDGSEERIEIINGECKVIVSAVNYFEQKGFVGIYDIDKVDEGVIVIQCDKLILKEDTPCVKEVSSGTAWDSDNNPHTCICVTLNY